MGWVSEIALLDFGSKHSVKQSWGGESALTDHGLLWKTVASFEIDLFPLMLIPIPKRFLSVTELSVLDLLLLNGLLKLNFFFTTSNWPWSILNGLLAVSFEDVLVCPWLFFKTLLLNDEVFWKEFAFPELGGIDCRTVLGEDPEESKSSVRSIVFAKKENYIKNH